MDQIAASSDEHFVPRLVTIEMAARLLGVGRTTLYELIAEGELQVVHIHRAARIPVEAIDAYVTRLRQGGARTGLGPARLRHVRRGRT